MNGVIEQGLYVIWFFYVLKAVIRGKTPICEWSNQASEIKIKVLWGVICPFGDLSIFIRKWLQFVSRVIETVK